MRPRDQIEARLWQITGRMVNGAMMDEIVELIEACAAEHFRDLQRLTALTEHERAVREFREHRVRDQQARLAGDMAEIIHLLAGMLDEEEGTTGETCPVCTLALPTRGRTCPNCGNLLPVARVSPDCDDADLLAGAR